MATTVKESFSQFATNLNITNRQENVVSTCRTNVVKTIGEKVSLHTDQPSILIGSYDRDTITRYLKDGDVDVMVVLHYGKNKEWDNKDGVRKALDRFKAILADAYPNTSCSIDRNCVIMKLSEFRLDVVPAFRFTEGHYTIPDTYRGAWLKTDPAAFSQEVTRINKVMGGDFVPLIKMIKGWNQQFNTPLRGFHLECIMVNRYKSYTQSYTFDSMVKVFFSELSSYLRGATYDPITGDQVDLYLDNDSLGYNRQISLDRATKAAALSEEAYNDGAKYPSVAINEWKKLMGEFFPAYG